MADFDRETRWSQFENELQELRTQMINEFEKRDLELLEYLKSNYLSEKKAPKKEEKLSGKTTGELPEKSFRYRDSLLTQLLKNNEHLRSFKNFVVAVFIIFMSHYFICNVYFKQKLDDDISVLEENFRGTFHTLATCWLPMCVSTMFVSYYGFVFWAKCRKWMKSQPIFADLLFLAFAAIYLVGFVMIPLKRLSGLPYCTRACIIPEQIRMVMKGYAFVRSNAPKVINKSKKQAKQETHDSNTSPSIPEFSKFVYYLFAPTLVYKDKYPRLSKIRWTYVLQCCVELLAVFWTLYIIAIHVCIPYYKSVDVKRMSLLYMASIYFGSLLYGGVIFILAFYGLLHLWMNLWAELLRFGDRRFYSEWWCAMSIGEYFRTWNTLVQDWIYTYLFMDFNQLFKKKRVLTLFCTLFVSSTVHDYLFAGIAEFYIPLFNVFYTIALITIFLPTIRNGCINSIVISMVAGMISVLLSFCALEIYSWFVFNCPQKEPNFPNYFNIKIINCFP